MVKRFLNCELVEIEEGDEIIQVAYMDIYDGGKLICKVNEEFSQLQKNVQLNVNRIFYAKPVEERVRIMKDLADKGGSLIITVIKDMLLSEYDKECCYTPASELFTEPKDA